MDNNDLYRLNYIIDDKNKEIDTLKREIRFIKISYPIVFGVVYFIFKFLPLIDLAIHLFK